MTIGRDMLLGTRGARSVARGWALCALAVVLAVYAGVILRPALATVRSLRHEIAVLTAQRTALASDESTPSVPERRLARVPLKAREVVPSISLLGRRSGLTVRTIKQAAPGEKEARRRIRVVARGTFADLLEFLDGVGRLLPRGEVEELTLRRTSAEIEMESLLHVPVDEPVPLRNTVPEVSS